MAEAAPVVIDMEESQVHAPLRQPEERQYIDILLLGKTGSGKSTTVDKLVTANIHGRNYLGDPHSEPERLEDRVKIDDITLWNLPGHKNPQQIEDRVKRVVVNRTVGEEPGDPNEDYDSPDSVTTHCELLANESTRVRVLDVPGFESSTSYTLPTQDHANGENPLQLRASYQQQQNLIIMRQILRIQVSKRLAFHRILYFLPCRGPPERADANLQKELSLMHYYFGAAIFDIMIIVVTYPSGVSKKDAFSDLEMRKTERNVRRAFHLALNEGGDGGLELAPIRDVPIIYISLEETGIEIYDKLCKTPVLHLNQEGLQLTFNKNLCARCGTQYGVIKDERIICFENDGEVQKKVPYDESKCHPRIVPRHSRLVRVLRGILIVVFLGIPLAAGAKWPTNDEVCALCKGVPGTPGCSKVFQEVELVPGSPKVKVDHTSNLDPVEQAGE